MTLQLALFERQISRIKILKEIWLIYLLILLLLEIVNIIGKDPDPEANN